MKAIAVLAWLSLLLVPIASQAQMNQQAVQKMLADLDRAIAQKDAGGVARLLSDGVTIAVTLRTGGESQTLKMDKPTYIDVLTKAWAAASEYEYKRTNLKITLSGPTRALVTATVTERMMAEGQKVFSTTNESAVVEWIGGRPLITRISANTQI